MSDIFEQSIPYDDEQSAAENHKITEAQLNSINYFNNVLIPTKAMEHVDKSLLSDRIKQAQKGFDTNQEVARQAREKDLAYFNQSKTSIKPKNKSWWKELLGW